MEFALIILLGITCYLIGFFFGRVTKTRAEMRKRDCSSDEDVVNREG